MVLYMVMGVNWATGGQDMAANDPGHNDEWQIMNQHWKKAR